MAERHMTFTEKRNAFLIILEAIFRLRSDFSPFGSGFHKVLRMLFAASEKVVFYWF